MFRLFATLKSQLRLLFLLLTLVPSLLLTLAATQQLLSALDRWENPSVQAALSGSLEVARNLVTRTKNDLRQRGQLLAADPALDAPDREAAVRERLATAYNLDFLQVYSTDGTLLFETTRDPLLAGPGPLAGVDPARAEFLEVKSLDLLAHVGLRGDPAGQEEVLVTGIYLNQGFYGRLDQLSRGYTLYSQVAALKKVNQRAVMLLVVVIVIVLGLGATGVATLLAARVSRPVVALADGMQKLAQGDDVVHVAPQGPAEMRDLTNTFNAMAGELARSRRELAQAERLAAWRDVARRVAHEIKNALTPITFSLHRVKRATESLPDTERERFLASLSTVMDEVEGLKRLAASFSELARLPVAELAPIDLGELVASTAAGFRETDPRIQVEVDPKTDLTIDGDRTLLRQALTNLLKNATEASPPQGTVRVTVESRPDQVQVRIEDEGAGWPDADPNLSLEPYYTTKEHGTGLGLSLVQRTMLQHAGTLLLEDRAEGGARVTLLLPRRKRPDSVHPDPTAQEAP